MEKNNIAVPVSIVIAGLLIAGAVYFGGSKKDVAKAPNQPQQPVKTADVRPLDKNDHIKGNPNAKVVIVEYSDLQCPFCQAFHETMLQVMDTYGKDGKVAWVYRHFPLIQIHPFAEKAAEGAECAAELGGNDKFWEFADNIFTDQSTQGKKVANLADVAVNIGLDKTKFQSCLDSGKYKAKVTTSLKEGQSLGVNGTPNSFVLVDGKQVDQFPGAVPFDNIKATLDNYVK